MQMSYLAGTEVPLLEAEDLQHTPQNNALSSSFRWLNNIVLYCPMWTKRKPYSKKFRSFWLSLMVLCLTISAILFHLVYVLMPYIPDVDIWIYRAIYASLEIIDTISIYSSIYYFYQYFNFPWITTGLQPFSQTQTREMFKYKTIIQLLLAIIFTLDIIMFVHYLLYDLQSGDVYFVAMVIIGRLFLFFPAFVAFAVSSTIFLKYHLIILQLIGALKKSVQVDFRQALIKYEDMKQMFEIDYNLYLKIFIQLYLLTRILDTWISSYKIISENHWIQSIEIVESICVAVMFVISASLIGESFDKYELFLFQYGRNHPQDVDYHFTYMISYVARYPFRIKIGTVTITKRNAVKFVVIFIGAKLISYSLSYISG
eukprot:159460_1